MRSAELEFRTPHSAFRTLFILSVQRMAPAATAELFELEPVRLVLFVLCRHVITFFALGALQNYVVPRHRTSF